MIYKKKSIFLWSLLFVVHLYANHVDFPNLYGAKYSVTGYSSTDDEKVYSPKALSLTNGATGDTTNGLSNIAISVPVNGIIGGTIGWSSNDYPDHLKIILPHKSDISDSPVQLIVSKDDVQKPLIIPSVDDQTYFQKKTIKNDLGVDCVLHALSNKNDSTSKIELFLKNTYNAPQIIKDYSIKNGQSYDVYYLIKDLYNYKAQDHIIDAWYVDGLSLSGYNNYTMTIPYSSDATIKLSDYVTLYTKYIKNSTGKPITVTVNQTDSTKIGTFTVDNGKQVTWYHDASGFESLDISVDGKTLTLQGAGGKDSSNNTYTFSNMLGVSVTFNDQSNWQISIEDNKNKLTGSFTFTSGSGTPSTPPATLPVIVSGDIALTGTYTVATDSVNSRTSYAYPKATYKGTEVFILIADKQNSDLGKVVGTVTSDVLSTLANNTSDSSIKKAFGDATYMSKGGFVLNIPGGSSTPPATPGSSSGSSTDTITQNIYSLKDEDMTVVALDSKGTTLATVTLSANNNAYKPLAYSKTTTDALVFTTVTSKLSKAFKISETQALQTDGWLTDQKNSDGSIAFGAWNMDWSAKGGGLSILSTDKAPASTPLTPAPSTGSLNYKLNNTSAWNLNVSIVKKDGTESSPVLVTNDNKPQNVYYDSATISGVKISPVARDGYTLAVQTISYSGDLTVGNTLQSAESIACNNVNGDATKGVHVYFYSSKTDLSHQEINMNATATSGGSSTPPALPAIVAGDIALTGTYTVATDSVNSRTGYAYPKATYKGTEVFILIADKQNSDLGTVVGTVTSDVLSTLANNTSDSSIKKAFGDATYMSKGGFVLNIPGGSSTPPASTGASYYEKSTSTSTLELSKTHAYTSKNPAGSYPYGILTMDGKNYDVIVQANTLPNPDGFTSPIAILVGDEYQKVVTSYGSILGASELPSSAQYANLYAFASYYEKSGTQSITLTGTVSTPIGTLATGTMNSSDIVIVPASVEQAYELELVELPDLGLVSDNLVSTDYKALKDGSSSNTAITSALGSDSEGYIFKKSDILALPAA